MFREIRRKEKQLTVAECDEVLEKAEYGTLATMGADGYPYVVPVNYVYHNGSIYFHCATKGHKLDNIKFCPNVSFSIVTDVWVVPQIHDEGLRESLPEFNGFNTNFNSITVFGKANEVIKREKIIGLKALLKKFLNSTENSRYEEEGINYIEKSLKRTKLIKIQIEYMTGKKGICKNTQI